jgi:hypothetical protein
VTIAARGDVDLDARPGRRYRISERSLYGSGANLATMRRNRRALRRALRRDPRTRTLALVAGGALAAVHVLSACAKVVPRRRGHATLISAAAAARDAARGVGQDGRVTPQ